MDYFHCIALLVERSCENCQHNSGTKALPQKVPLWCGGWIRGASLHSEVRWLSRSSVLQRYYSLGSNINTFLNEKGRPLREITDLLWLAFLVDLTDHLNTLNKRLQGKKELVLQLYAHMKALCAWRCLFRVTPAKLQCSALPHTDHNTMRDSKCPALW